MIALARSRYVYRPALRQAAAYAAPAVVPAAASRAATAVVSDASYLRLFRAYQLPAYIARCAAFRLYLVPAVSGVCIDNIYLFAIV